MPQGLQEVAFDALAAGMARAEIEKKSGPQAAREFDRGYTHTELFGVTAGLSGTSG